MTEKDATVEEVVYDSWEEGVEEQLKVIFDAFLPLSVEGGIRIEYKRAVVERYEDGSVKYDPKRVVGVKVNVDLDFAAPVDLEEEAAEK